MAASDNINTSQARPVIQLTTTSQERQRPIIQLQHPNDDTYEHHWEEGGQGTLFSPKVGTGLSTDPVSRQRRRELVNKIVNSEVYTQTVYPERVVKAHDYLNKSNIPLQHLSDVAHSGTKLMINPDRIASSYLPTKNIMMMSGATHTNPEYTKKRAETVNKEIGTSVEPDQISEHAYLHEFGHAYHHTRYPVVNDLLEEPGIRLNEHATNFFPYLEGVADAYARRHMSSQFDAVPYFDYTAHIGKSIADGNMGDDAVHARNVYANTRDYVMKTGDVPFISMKSANVHDLLTRPTRMGRGVPIEKTPEEKHPQLPGMED